MPYNVTVPELSESVVEATVSSWLKKEGESVKAGEVIAILETDKISLEVAAGQTGVIVKIHYPEGADVGPGDTLCEIEAKEGSAVVASPSQSTPTPVTPSPLPVAEAKATPVAKRVAATHEVDLTKVTPSGGKITKNDVESYLGGQHPTSPTSASQPSMVAPVVPSTSNTLPSLTGEYRREERIRMSRRRQTIAKRLVESQQTAAMLTTFNEIDMYAVMEIRKRRKDSFKEKFGVGLGLSSFFVKATLGALKKFPRLNAEIQGNEIILKHYYDIGIAIGAEEGLVVPVLRDADRMSFAEIEHTIKDFAQQTEAGTLSIESLRGGTFTITNGGVFGSMMSTPILNPPQVGILGLHAIKDRPVVLNGEIKIRPMMYVALTYDHRIVDGRESVQFLVRVKELMEDPETLLIEG
jgi:2-oxoglutarate dehydrogenase E2 component (dihydrolipoamide succinyltransferase)